MKREKEDLRRKLQETVERVEIGVRGLDVHHELGVLEILLGVDARRRFERLPDLEVRLPVEVLRLDVADPVRIRGREDDDICWYLLVVSEKNDVSYLELLPVKRNPGGSAEFNASKRRRKDRPERPLPLCCSRRRPIPVYNSSGPTRWSC